MSKLLIEEPPLQVLPSLAEAIGLQEAIVVQQLHYWTRRSNNTHDGHRWVYNTINDWHDQFPFWSKRTIQRILKRLKANDYIITAKPHKRRGDTTVWYRLNYEELGNIESSLPSQAAGPEASESEATADTDTPAPRADLTFDTFAHPPLRQSDQPPFGQPVTPFGQPVTPLRQSDQTRARIMRGRATETTNRDYKQRGGAPAREPARDPVARNDTSTTTSTNTSTGASHASSATSTSHGQQAVEVIEQAFDRSLTSYQREKIRYEIDTKAALDAWEQTVDRLAMQEKTSRNAIGWALQDYEDALQTQQREQSGEWRGNYQVGDWV